jgi:hypothetical protein
MVHYDNTPTVVVVLVPVRGGLLMVRRTLPGEGYGKLALPGGYQMLGQTWQEAGALDLQNLACALLVGLAARNSERSSFGTTATSFRVSAATSECRQTQPAPKRGQASQCDSRRGA